MEELFFKDVSFKDMGLIIEEIEPIFTRSPLRTNEVDVEGRENDFEELNYQNVTCDLKLTLLNAANLDAVNAWLQGTGDLRYNNRVRTARIYCSFEYARLNDFYKELNVQLIMGPYWKQIDDYLQVTNEVVNEGTVAAKPVIKLIGSGTVDITINQVRFVYNFDQDGAVEIDCERQSERWNGLSKSSQIELGYEYPYLRQGSNVITANSGACEIYIKNRSWYL